MSDLADIDPIDDAPQASAIGCPVCRNGVMLPPEFNLPSVQCPTCGAVFGRLTGQVISGPLAGSMQMPYPPQAYYRSPLPPGMSGAPRGAAPMQRARTAPPREAGIPAMLIATLVVGGVILAAAGLWALMFVIADSGGQSGDDYSAPRDFAEMPTRPRPEWHDFRDEQWGFRASFPNQFKVDRDETSGSGPQLSIAANSDLGRYSIDCYTISEDRANEIRRDLRQYAEAESELALDETALSSRGESVDGRPAYRITTNGGRGSYNTLVVVVDEQNLFHLSCHGHERFAQQAEGFFSSFRMLKSKFGASAPTGVDDRPLLIYFIGNDFYTPGLDYHSILVARNGENYKWTIVQESLPKGIQAFPSDDRVVVQGKCDDPDGAGVLKVKVVSGDATAEYELALVASKRR